MINLKIALRKTNRSEATYVIRPIDQVMFEEKYPNTNFLEAFEVGTVKASYVYYLAFCSADSSQDFHTFVREIDTIVDILIDDVSVFVADPDEKD